MSLHQGMDIKQEQDVANSSASAVNNLLKSLEPEMPIVANNTQARIAFIKSRVIDVIRKLANASKKAHGLPDSSAPLIKDYLSKLAGCLIWLDQELEMSETIRKGAPALETAIRMIIGEQPYHFEPRFQVYARRLLDKWINENWGKGEVLDDTESGNEGTIAGAERPRGSVAEANAARQLPTSDSRIFARGGIMYGAIRKESSTGRRDWVLDPHCPKRSGKVYGHNDIPVGQWYPFRILALFNGAHSMKMAGIAGHVDTGAWSIVASGTAYDHLDEDRGEKLWYSGSNSADNTDPTQPFPSSTGTKALKSSLRTRNPVRVLRGAGGSVWGPSDGLRYDGLYQVVSMHLPVNQNGGLYEQFELHRLRDQPCLESCRLRPNARELRDLQEVRGSYL